MATGRKPAWVGAPPLNRSSGLAHVAPRAISTELIMYLITAAYSLIVGAKQTLNEALDKYSPD